MYKIFLLSLSCSIIAIAAVAQNAGIYKWDEHPTLHQLPADYTNESAVIIKDDVNIEYRSELKSIYVYRSVHRIVRVLDEKGIEGFNKVTIPMANGKTIEFIKARTILPNGKVIEVGSDKIKTMKDEDGVPQYLFAMEGVEKNAEVELQYTEKKPVALFGSETFQYRIPVLQATFSLQVPEKMIFLVKGYNNFPKTHDTLIDGMRYYTASASNIAPMHEEPYGDDDAMAMRVEYKLNYLPEQNPDLRMLTWNDLAKQLFNELYNISNKESKAAERYLKELGVSDADSEEDKIRKIEDGIKSTIVLNKDLDGDDVTKLENIFKNKTTNEEGLTRLLAACFTLADIKHQVGMSSNRFDHPVDEAFENWNFIDAYVFYFPKEKKFLAPTAIYSRYPFVPSYLLGNKGVFCKVNTDEGVSVRADIKEIAPMPISETQNNIDAVVSFNGEDLDPQIETTHSFSGYSAMGVREAMVLLPKDKQKDAVEGIINLSDNPADMLTYKTANSAFHNYYDNKPLKLTATLRASSLMDKAGPKYLFKIGEVIGKQVEMYHDMKRQLPIDIPFPHSETRTITVQLPAGYKILNPDAIRMHADDAALSGKPTMGFNADYKLDGDKLLVNINEYYSQMNYPVSYYETFRKVINASADFNKVVLVLVKK